MSVKSESKQVSALLLSTASVRHAASKENRHIKRVIGLDPALSFGWAYWDVRETDRPLVSHSGTWKLEVPAKVKHGRDGYRFSQARAELEKLVVPECVIFYEKAVRHIGTAAAHSAGGYYAIIRSVAYDNCVNALPAAVGTVKKYATGSGSATKPEMIASVNEYLRLSGSPISRSAGEGPYAPIGPKEDDRADAFAVLMWGVSQL